MSRRIHSSKHAGDEKTESSPKETEPAARHPGCTKNAAEIGKLALRILSQDRRGTPRVPDPSPAGERRRGQQQGLGKGTRSRAEGAQNVHGDRGGRPRGGKDGGPREGRWPTHAGTWSKVAEAKEMMPGNVGLPERGDRRGAGMPGEERTRREGERARWGRRGRRRRPVPAGARLA